MTWWDVAAVGFVTALWTLVVLIAVAIVLAIRGRW